MAKYKPYDYSQGVMLTVFLEEQIMPGTLEFAIHTLVETRMDLSIFDDRLTLFESISKARVKDCIEKEDIIFFIVAEG